MTNSTTSIVFIGALTWSIIAIVKRVLPSRTAELLNRWWPLIAVGIAMALVAAPVELVRAIGLAVEHAPPETGMDPAMGVTGGAAAVLLHALIRTTVKGK